MFVATPIRIVRSMGKLKKDAHRDKMLEWIAYAVAIFTLTIIYLMWSAFD